MNLAWLPTPCNILAGKCKDLKFPCTQLKMPQLLVEMSGLHHIPNPERNLRAANASVSICWAGKGWADPCSAPEGAGSPHGEVGEPQSSWASPGPALTSGTGTGPGPAGLECPGGCGALRACRCYQEHKHQTDPKESPSQGPGNVRTHRVPSQEGSPLTLIPFRQLLSQWDGRSCGRGKLLCVKPPQGFQLRMGSSVYFWVVLQS